MEGNLQVNNENLSGIIKHIMWDSDSYQAFVMKVDHQINGSSKVKCKSFFNQNSLNVGDELTFFGHWIVDPKYGKEFEIVARRANVPTEPKQISQYLEKHINGVGPTLAERIVDMFGEKTWDIIEDKPEVLCEVHGISVSKAMKISAEYINKIGTRDDVIWFNSHKIDNGKYISAIKEKYGNKYQDVISANPYVLINDITGIGFKKADEIAKTFGIENTSPFRVAAGIKFILENSQNFGHVYLTEDTLLKEGCKLLYVSANNIKDVLARLLEPDLSKRAKDPVCFINLINDDGAIYEYRMYREENFIASKIAELSRNFLFKKPEDKAFEKMDEIAREHYGNDFELDKSQKNAALIAINNPVSVITGGPGTGKTTTLNTIISYFKDEFGYCDDEFTLLAPTGKAAKRMSEQTSLPAMTLHRATGYPNAPHKDIKSKVVIVDEMSMADMHIVNSLMKSVVDVRNLIFVGDIDQLPSVGCGNILKDIIESGVVPVARLDVIHRQAEKSGIIKYSHNIIDERMFPDMPPEEDFTFIMDDNAENVEKQVIELYTKGLPEYLLNKGLDPTSVQILTPLRKENYKLSSDSFNKLIQKKYADVSKMKECVTFFENTIYAATYYVGDKVIHLKNDYNLIRQRPDGSINNDGVMNGETGTVVEVDKKYKMITVKYGDELATYTKDNINELALAYALTIHKSQGSEYQAVIIPIVSGGFQSIMNKNLLYTAVTRAKSQVIIIGNKKVLAQMVHTKFSEKRNTKLAMRLKEA